MQTNNNISTATSSLAIPSAVSVSTAISVSTPGRPIYWKVPAEFQVFMYIFFAAALYFLGKKLFRIYTFIKSGPGELNLNIRDKIQWKKFLTTLLLQRKINRDPLVGRFHGLIFYSFLIHVLATLLVMIHVDTPFKVFQGVIYIAISFLADLAGVTMVIGITIAAWRRYWQRPAYLNSSSNFTLRSEMVMYLTLLVLVAIGFILEGLRIYGTNPDIASLMSDRERQWSPFGWHIAYLLHLWSPPLSNSSFLATHLTIIYRSLWLFHMLSTMFFIATIGTTKFIHLLLLPFAALVTPDRRAGIWRALDLTSEQAQNAEWFGLGALSDLGKKQRLDLESCVECGRCSQHCPAKEANRPLDPKQIIVKMRDEIRQKNYGTDPQNPPSIPALYQNNELTSCTTCNACAEECPANIEHIQIISELKRYNVLTKGEISPECAEVVSNIRMYLNPWGLPPENRAEWVKKLKADFGVEVPIIEEGKKVEYLYFVGCAAAYEARAQAGAIATARLLNAAGVDYAILGRNEPCTGDPIRRFGDEYNFQEIVRENITLLKKYSFKYIITGCPHCFHTLSKEYPQFPEGKFSVIHISELLLRPLRIGKLKTATPSASDTSGMPAIYTYHDPCYLGRHHGEYNANREILRRSGIDSKQIREMPLSRDRSRCCGMGGGNMWFENPEGEHLALNRLRDVSEAGATTLVTSCPFCLINFETHKEQYELQVVDVAELLAANLESGKPGNSVPTHPKL